MESEVEGMQLEDGGKDHEPRNKGGHLETGKGQEGDSSLQPAEEKKLCQHLDFSS